MKPTTNVRREREWLEAEVAAAASLTDADRVRILRDLRRTAAAIRAGKSADELDREERYRALAERLAG